MRKLLAAACLASALMMTGCSLSTNHSPLLIEECKAVAKDPVQRPDDSLMSSLSDPVPYTREQIQKGTSRSEVVDNQTENNLLWGDDRNKAKGLQDYIKKLQEQGIIAK